LHNLKPLEKGRERQPGRQGQGICTEFPQGYARALAEGHRDPRRGPEQQRLAQQWAVQQVLDRAWGKAPQAITGEGGEGGVVFVAIDTGIRRNRPAMIEGKE
jgi:hypothetical protein